MVDLVKFEEDFRLIDKLYQIQQKNVEFASSIAAKGQNPWVLLEQWLEQHLKEQQWLERLQQEWLEQGLSQEEREELLKQVKQSPNRLDLDKVLGIAYLDLIPGIIKELFPDSDCPVSESELSENDQPSHPGNQENTSAHQSPTHQSPTVESTLESTLDSTVAETTTETCTTEGSTSSSPPLGSTLRSTLPDQISPSISTEETSP